MWSKVRSFEGWPSPLPTSLLPPLLPFDSTYTPPRTSITSMSYSSQQESDSKKGLQGLDRNTTRRDDQHTVSSQSGMTLLRDHHECFPSVPSPTASLKRPRDEEPTTLFPPNKLRRQMLITSTRASRRRNRPTESDDAKPRSASRDHDMEDVSPETKESAELSTAHHRSSWEEEEWRQSPNHLPDTSSSENTEMREICQDIDEDAGEPESAPAESSEADELANELDRLGMEDKLAGFGGQFDGDLAKYPDFEINLP